MSGLLESATGLVFAAPWMLLLALLVPVALLLRLRRGWPAVGFAPAPFLRGVPGTWRTALLAPAAVLPVVGLLLLVVALARPVQRDRLPTETEGIDMLLCLDLSSSMSATDMETGALRRTRLEVARDAAVRFVQGRPDDRIGLLCFARYPDLRCPPTLDHDALVELLDRVETVESDGPEDATGIGAAVARAAQVLRGSGAPSRVVILLTDGEENVATEGAKGEIAPVHAAQLCERLGVRVYTVAAGVEAGGDGDSGGRASIGSNRVDTTQVERLSERTGGTFFAARDATALASVYGAIDALERVTLDRPRYRDAEHHLPFLLAGVVLLLTGRLAGATVLRVVP